MAMKFCRHGEVVHKTTSLQGFLNSGFAAIDERQKKYRYYNSTIGLALIWRQY